MTNQDIARKLRDHASEMAKKNENLYRVRAFRRAAMVVMGLTEEVSELVRHDRRRLENVPGIGKSLAETIIGYAK
jgi:DNA polymerase (family 10)